MRWGRGRGPGWLAPTLGSWGNLVRSDKSPKNAPGDGSWDLPAPAAPSERHVPVPVPGVCGVLLRVSLEEAAAGAKSPLGKARGGRGRAARARRHGDAFWGRGSSLLSWQQSHHWARGRAEGTGFRVRRSPP